MRTRELGLETAVINQASREASHGRDASSDFSMLIDGQLVEVASTVETTNPGPGRLLTSGPRADRAQLEQAVAAAKAAFPSWSATPLRARAGLLARLADALEAEKDAFARLLTQEQGKPLPQALGEIEYSVAALSYFAALDMATEV